MSSAAAINSGEWLAAALEDLRQRSTGGGGGLELDGDLISGLVSFCEFAPPLDAADYLANIVGAEAAQDVIQEYLRRRGYVDTSYKAESVQASSKQVSMKPSDKMSTLSKKQNRTQAWSSSSMSGMVPHENPAPLNASNISGGNPGITKKKKGAKVISLADAAKGSLVFQQGKPCSCQARKHKLVSNCLSCGKIVCEQEGEGPCSFCGSLVLREGSTYAGLSDIAPLSETEAAAEAYAKRLVDYDRNSAARTQVIDDQSDYYEIDGNSWLSAKEKEVIRKQQKEAQEAADAQKGKVVVTFDLVGRKVILNKDEATKLEKEYGILSAPPEDRREQQNQANPVDKDVNRIIPNPSVRVQPKFVDTGSARARSARGKHGGARLTDSLCLEITGRVLQPEEKNLKLLSDIRSTQDHYLAPNYASTGHDDDPECS